MFFLTIKMKNNMKAYIKPEIIETIISTEPLMQLQVVSGKSKNNQVFSNSRRNSWDADWE